MEEILRNYTLGICVKHVIYIEWNLTNAISLL